MTTTDRRTLRTFLAALVLTGIASAAFLAARGFDDAALAESLRYTGRVAFVILMVVFAARPLQQLLKKPWTAKLLRNRRQFGVAFAGIHIAHLGLIALRVRESAEMTVENVVNPLAATVYLAIFVMLATSFSAPAKKIGTKAWTALHKVGIYILFTGFVTSQLPRSPGELEFANAVLLALAATGLALRVAAFVRSRR